MLSTRGARWCGREEPEVFLLHAPHPREVLLALLLLLLFLRALLLLLLLLVVLVLLLKSLSLRRFERVVAVVVV